MKEELGKNKEEREEKESGRPTLFTPELSSKRNIFLLRLLQQRQEYIGITFMNGLGSGRILIQILRRRGRSGLNSYPRERLLFILQSKMIVKPGSRKKAKKEGKEKRKPDTEQRS